MPHWGTKSKISACSDEPDDSCSGCNKVVLREMLPQQKIRPAINWLGLPQPWSCMSGCKRDWRTLWGHSVLYLPGMTNRHSGMLASCLQAACTVVLWRESRRGRERTLVVATPGAALSLGTDSPAGQFLFPGSVGLEVRLRVRVMRTCSK